MHTRLRHAKEQGNADYDDDALSGKICEERQGNYELRGTKYELFFPTSRGVIETLRIFAFFAVSKIKI